MADPAPPHRKASESAESASLRARVDAARARHAPKGAAEGSNPASLAMRFGGEFGAAVLVGAGLGYGVDYWAGSGPWGLIIGLSVGFAAGVVNVVRAARAYAQAHPVEGNAPSIPDEAED